MEAKSKKMKVTTSDGKELKIPIVGLGTYGTTTPGEAYEVVKEAIKCGYRHFDCAYVYDNEEEIGRAIKEAIDKDDVKREELFIVSKLWTTFSRPDRVIKCIEESLKRLKTSYLDLYLVHWPFGFEQQDKHNYPKDKNGHIVEEKDFDLCQTWKAMEELVSKGLTKAIGVSNCNSKQLAILLRSAKIKPLTNQIEVHPYLPNTKLINWCKSNGIIVTAYSPLGGQKIAAKGQKVKKRKEVIEDPVVKKIAEQYGTKTAGQVLIRFGIERGLLVIPKTVKRGRLVENINVFDFKLSKEEVEQLVALDCGFRSCDFNVPDIPKFRTYPFAPAVEF